MQKRVSHYNLDYIKELISANQYFITQCARQGYFGLGFDDDDKMSDKAIVISFKERT